MLTTSWPYRQLLRDQNGVVSRAQCLGVGITVATIGNQLRCGRWQQLHRGVYATFTGDLSREQQLWAALLRAGPGATFSHETAAELHGILDKPSAKIHITVPMECDPARCGRIPGVVVYRSRALGRTCQPIGSPPRTRVEDTVLDLVESSASFADAYSWICRAIGRRRTTADRIRAALDRRARFSRRREVQLALADAASGALSWLERTYVRGVERPHALPTASRQARVSQRTGNKYLDNLYESYGLCVEIDGTVAHPADEQWRDKRRDRRNLVYGKIDTLRFGYLDLRDQRGLCETAAEIVIALTDRAPKPDCVPENAPAPTVGRACGLPDCPVGANRHDCAENTAIFAV
jgi:hypothetical protein